MSNTPIRHPNTLGRLLHVVLGATLALIGGVAFAAVTAGASHDGGDTTLVPITACRIVDTRPDSQVGPRGAPLGADETMTVAATGASTDCAIPEGAAGLTLNVTIVGATLPTFVSVWDDGDLPAASSLNPAPAAPPTTNAVTTGLTDAGTFNVYNLQGSVDVVIDVTAFHTTDVLDSLNAQISRLERDIASTNRALSTLDRNQAFTVWHQGPDSVSFDGGDDITSTSLTAPTDGTVTATASGYVNNLDGGDFARCALSETVTSPAFSPTLWVIEISSGADDGLAKPFHTTRVFDVEAAEELVVFLVCETSIGNSASMSFVQLSLAFTPDPLRSVCHRDGCRRATSSSTARAVDGRSHGGAGAEVVQAVTELVDALDSSEQRRRGDVCGG